MTARLSGRGAITRATLLPALHSALASWEGPLRAEATTLRDRLRAEVLASIEREGLRATARTYGVAVSALQRWRESGGCLAETGD